MYKIYKILPSVFHKTLNSYLTGKKLFIKHGSFMSGKYNIEAGVPQGRIIFPVLSLLYTAHLLTSAHLPFSTFADDTTILSSHKNPYAASHDLTKPLRKIDKWFTCCRIKVGERRFNHATFTLKKRTCPVLQLNGVSVPQSNEVTYLGLHLDRRLALRKHIEIKNSDIWYPAMGFSTNICGKWPNSEC